MGADDMKFRITPTDIKILKRAALVILAVPTFYMPLMYLGALIFFFGGLLGLWPSEDMPEWLHEAGSPVTTVLLVMWPIYILWALLTKVWSRKEKAFWIFVIVVTNLIGMPGFFVLTTLKYTGKYVRRPPDLPSARTRWFARVVLLAVAAGLLYMAVRWYSFAVDFFADAGPAATRLVIIDATGRQSVHEPDPETLRLQTRTIFLLGASAGVYVGLAIWLLWLATFGGRRYVRKKAGTESEPEKESSNASPTRDAPANE